MGGLHNSIKILFSLFDLDPVLVQSSSLSVLYLWRGKLFQKSNLTIKSSVRRTPSLFTPKWTVKSGRPKVDGKLQSLKLWFWNLKTIFLCGWRKKTEWRRNIYWCLPPYRSRWESIVLLNILQSLFRLYSIQNWH